MIIWKNHDFCRVIFGGEHTAGFLGISYSNPCTMGMCSFCRAITYLIVMVTSVTISSFSCASLMSVLVLVVIARGFRRRSDAFAFSLQISRSSSPGLVHKSSRNPASSPLPHSKHVVDGHSDEAMSFKNEGSDWLPGSVVPQTERVIDSATLHVRI